MRTIFGILSILLGLLWAFHAEVRDTRELAAMACQACEYSRRNWALAIDRSRRSFGHDVARMAGSAPFAST